MKKCLVFFLGLLLFVSCDSKKKSKVSKIINDTINTPKYDLETVVVTNDNVVDFLTWYGSFNPENHIVITTKFGEIEVELYDETSLHRANTIYLIKKAYYNTTFFHRVVKGFVVQGGNSDESKTSKSRKKIGKYTLPSEFLEDKKHDFSALCAARSWVENPDKRSDPYEFYFVHNRMGEHHLNQEHTVYGKITKGVDVLDSIASQDTDRGDYPLFNVNMTVALKKE